MKKFACTVLALILAVLISACGNAGGQDSTQNTTPMQETEPPIQQQRPKK